jgi:outer membrane receptor for ferrienterochelin and colicins
MKRFLLCLFVCLSFGVSSQVTLVFSVRDGLTDLPVPNAHLRLYGQNDTLLTRTNTLGEASIKLAAVPLAVSVSHIAYQALNQKYQTNTTNTILYVLPAQGQLAEIIVTGQTTPILAREAVKQVRVISRERIDKQAAVNLKELLTNDLNFRVSEDGILGSQLSLQGLSGAKVKILIDGVPIIGRLDGNIDLSQINLNNIERVEIIEGPMSVQYGTDAVAGTINLITKRQVSNSLKATLNTYYETVGRYNFDATINYPLFKNWHSQLSLGRNYFDGFHPVEGERNLQWNAKEQYFTTLSVQKRFKNLLLRFNTEFFNETILNAGAIGGFDSAVVPVDTGAWKYPQALDDRYQTTRLNNALYAQYYFKKGASLKAFAAYNHFRRVKTTHIKNLHTGNEQLFLGTDAQDTSVFNSYSSRLFYEKDWLPKKLSSQIGYDANYEINSGQRIDNRQRSIADIGIFAALNYKPTDVLTLEPGLRVSYNSLFTAPVIASFATRWQATENWVYRLSYGQGFRAPSLKELYFLFVDENHNILGNADLKAETSHNFQVGATYVMPSDKADLEITASTFFNDITNEIRLIAVISPNDDEPRGLFRNENIARTQTTGASANAKFNYKGFSSEAGFSIIGIKNNLAFRQEQATAQFPNFNFYPQARLNLSYNFAKLGLVPSVFINHTGERKDLSSNTSGEIGQTTFQAFTVADFTLQKTFFNTQLNLALGVKNLMNITNLQADQQISGGAHNAGSSAVPFSYGRTYFMRLRYQIQ